MTKLFLTSNFFVYPLADLALRPSNSSLGKLDLLGKGTLFHAIVDKATLDTALMNYIGEF